MAAAARPVSDDPHIPVLLRPLLDAVAPVRGTWLDGTCGAGGYTRGLFRAGADRVIAIDRDPSALAMARSWAGQYGDRLVMCPGVFSQMDGHVRDIAGDSEADTAPVVDGVVLDLGVSSMQLDQAKRGFSFLQDGPLDMRMSQSGPQAGPSAADLVNTASETGLADILFHYGEERASRRIARAIVRARADTAITTTGALAAIVESCLPRSKPGQSHPATRSFQAIRIAVNREYAELHQGLMAAERVLKPGGWLAVVSFHSIEDRMVKRFLQSRAGQAGRANRYAPETAPFAPRFSLEPRKPISADAQELAINPRARSARLRLARRTDAPAGGIDANAIGMPLVKENKR